MADSEAQYQEWLKSLSGTGGGAPAQAEAAPQEPGILDRAVSAVRDHPSETLAALTPAAVLSAAPAALANAASENLEKSPEARAGVVDAVENAAKDTLASAPAMALGPVGILAGPTEQAVARKLVRAHTPGEPDKSDAQAIKEGLVEGGIETAATLATMGLPALRRVPEAISSRLNKSKLIGALDGYLKQIVERNGPPAARKTVAGKMIEEGTKLAGDVPLPVSNVIKAAEDEISRMSTKGVGGGGDIVKELRAAREEIGEAGTMTLGELQRAKSVWGQRVEDWANDPARQRLAKVMQQAYAKDLQAAMQNTVLGPAAQILSEGTATYGKAARDAKLQALITSSEDPTSVDKFINPRVFAAKNSGKNRAKVERLLADDPEALQAWRDGVDAAKVLSKKGTSWLPADLKSPKITEAVNNLMTSRNVVKIFSDPQSAAAFKRLLSPEASMAPEAAMALIGQISTRISQAPSLGSDGAPPANNRAEPNYLAGTRP
jgi:hypothetical protein